MSKMPWFRMYSEARNDAKLRALPDDQFRVWFNLLCFASEQGDERGVLGGYDIDLLAIEVANGDTDLLEATLDRIVKLRIISIDGEAIRFLNFKKRQYDKPSDTPERVAERVRRHRERQSNAEETPDEQEETPSEHDVTPCNDTDKERDRERDLVSADALTAGNGQKRRRSRPPDLIFDTFCDVLGIDPKRINRTERGKLNAACLDVREINGTPDEIRLVAKRYRERWPNIDISATAITGNWQRMLNGAGAPKRETAEEIYGDLEENIRRFADVPEHLLNARSE